MIIKARAGRGGPALARYLDGGKNDAAELLELRNLDAPSLKAALYDMDLLAHGSRCHHHALHVQMRAAPGEQLSVDQWRDAADRYAEAFGLEEHQAALILHHQEDGATHAHVVFNRVHPETIKAADLWQNYEKHKDLARQMERDWGLQPVQNDKRAPARDYSPAGRGEEEQARRTGENVHDRREHIRELWEHSATGAEFVAALEDEGWQLAKGDRRAYVVVDEHGSPYSLGKRSTGASAKEVREKLADLDPELMPNLEQARQWLEEREEEHRPERKQRGRSEGTPPRLEPDQTPAASWWSASERRAEQVNATHMADIHTPTVEWWKVERPAARTVYHAPQRPTQAHAEASAKPHSTPELTQRPTQEFEKKSESRLNRILREREEARTRPHEKSPAKHGPDFER